MPDLTEDPAIPGALRRASDQHGAWARDLDGTVRSLRTIGTGLLSGALVGPCGVRFQNTLDGLHAGFLAARAAHEEVADAMRRAAGPIEDEQEARRALKRAGRRLAEARRRLTEEQGRVAAREKAATVHAMAGNPVPPVDRSGLMRAEREVEEAEFDVRRAERRHLEAAGERARVVRALTTVCHTATVLGPLPATPGEVLFGPRLHDTLKDRRMRDVGHRTAGHGLTARERRRLTRNGLAPGSPLFSLLYGTRPEQGTMFERSVNVKGRNGEAGAGYALGHREYELSGGLGRMGTRYGMHVGAGVEAYAGAKAGIGGEADIAGVKPSAGVDAQAGAGASLGGEISEGNGKLKLAGSAGLAFGIGGKLKGGVEIDVSKLGGHLADGVKAIKGVLPL